MAKGTEISRATGNNRVGNEHEETQKVSLWLLQPSSFCVHKSRRIDM